MSILGDGIVPTGDGPEDDDITLVRFQRDRFLEDLTRVTTERDRYFAEVEALRAKLAAGSPSAAELAGSDEVESAVPGAERDEFVAELELERDGYLEDVRRLTAEFQNFRKQTDRRNAEVADHAKGDLLGVLLPALDAVAAAVAHGAADVEPVQVTLRQALEKEGMEIIEPTGQPFDPNRHDAVMREDGEDGGEPIVVETFRLGYSWKGRIIRPAMVKVRT